MPDKAGHAVLRHLAESNQDTTLDVGSILIYFNATNNSCNLLE